ncbi:MAG: hypothetical protein V8R67_03130 [Eubacterium sp.]
MMIQRDSLTENMILQGRYEVRKATHTTQVERDYDVYDREEKKEYQVKEFYPSNYCSRGADGQTVIVRGARNQSVFEQSKEWFAQAYRQIAASTKTKGFPEAVRLFSENNTIYVILEKSDGGRLSEQIRHAGGKLSYAESVPILRAIVETLLQMQPPKGYLPKISKESILLLKKQNKTEVIFTDIVQKEDVIYSVGSLWAEMLTGLCPQTSSLRAPSELGVELPSEAEQMILRCLEKNTENRVSLEELLSILPRGRKENDRAYEKTSFISCRCADFCDSSMEKSASERERSFGRGKAALFDRNGRCGKDCVIICHITGSDSGECGKCAGDNGDGCKQGGFRRGPDKYAGAPPGEDGKDKTETKKEEQKEEWGRKAK